MKEKIILLVLICRKYALDLMIIPIMSLFVFATVKDYLPRFTGFSFPVIIGIAYIANKIEKSRVIKYPY